MVGILIRLFFKVETDLSKALEAFYRTHPSMMRLGLRAVSTRQLPSSSTSFLMDPTKGPSRENPSLLKTKLEPRFVNRDPWMDTII